MARQVNVFFYGKMCGVLSENGNTYTFTYDNEYRGKSLSLSMPVTQKISLEDLSLQTEISVSTLKRLLLNPENARVGHLMSVCKELGINVWLDK